MIEGELTVALDFIQRENGVNIDERLVRIFIL